jgi:DNA-directed RNA polymerase subunit RPC12/RpoP
MGAVAMKDRSTGLVDRGYPVSEATLYIYCDNCGSFNIKTYVPVIKLLVVAIVLVVIVFLVLNYYQWLACLLPLGWIASLLPWRDILLKYKCRKCGNVHISDYNSLNYQAYDMSVVDVSDKLTQKRYIDSDVLHFQQFT